MTNKKPSLEKVMKEFQKFIYRLQMPMSVEAMTHLQTGSLRQIASIFKSFNGAEARGWTKSDLVRFISGHQRDPSQYKPIERIHGIEYPNIEDQHYRKMFEDQRDPWKRPGKI